MITWGPATELWAASTHTPGPLEGKIFGTLFVVLSVLIVVGYCAFEWKYGRRARCRKRMNHTTDDERSA